MILEVEEGLVTEIMVLNVDQVSNVHEHGDLSVTKER